MAPPDVALDALILRKTKLGEADLILLMMDEEGMARKAVAKGARKPRNAGSAKLELFNEAHVVLAQGKSLSIVKESRLLASGGALHQDPVRFAAAAMVAEAASACIQPELPVEHLHPMTKTAFRALKTAPEDVLPLLVAAYLLKAAAFLGTRPSLSLCACCGDAPRARNGRVRFSCQEGGIICDACASDVQTMALESGTAALCHELLHGTFDGICALTARKEAWDALLLSARWFKHHVGCRLKSLETFRSLIISCPVPPSGL